MEILGQPGVDINTLLSFSTSVCMTALEWHIARYLQIIQRTFYAHCVFMNYMCIDHRHAHILMFEQFLDGSNNCAALQ